VTVSLPFSKRIFGACPVYFPGLLNASIGKK